MSKKHQKKKRSGHKRIAPAQFSVGDRVRVKPGIVDPDFSDIPLGGCTGTIHDVDPVARPKLYLVEWTEETLDQMHPVFRNRCLRDGLEIESMWLDESDLQLDNSDPVRVEQPTNLVSRALSKHDQDDRIRAIFALTSDDPLPAITDENLRTYHRYLATRLAFPFQAKYLEDSGNHELLVTVMGLLDVDERDDEEGLLCEVTQANRWIEVPLILLESTINIHNRELLSDYAYWFCNGPAADGDMATIPSADAFTPPRRGWFARLVISCGVWGGLIGIPLGALFATSASVQFATLVGAALVAVLGCIFGARFGQFYGSAYQVRFGPLYAGIGGTIAGAALGAVIGAMLGAIVGLLLGAIIGAFVSQWLLPVGKRRVGAALGAFAGGLVQAVHLDQESAVAGALYGAIVGISAGVLIVLVLFGLLMLMGPSRR